MSNYVLAEGERIVGYVVERPDGTQHTVAPDNRPLPAAAGESPFVDRSCNYCREPFLQRVDEARRRFCGEDCRRLAMDGA